MKKPSHYLENKHNRRSRGRHVQSPRSQVPRLRRELGQRGWLPRRGVRGRGGLGSTSAVPIPPGTPGYQDHEVSSRGRHQFYRETSLAGVSNFRK